ncbi:MAG: hypothetical protein WCQ95_00065 [Bacteroidota bacterium]
MKIWLNEILEIIKKTTINNEANSCAGIFFAKLMATIKNIKEKTFICELILKNKFSLTSVFECKCIVPKIDATALSVLSRKEKLLFFIFKTEISGLSDCKRNAGMPVLISLLSALKLIL